MGPRHQLKPDYASESLARLSLDLCVKGGEAY